MKLKRKPNGKGKKYLKMEPMTRDLSLFFKVKDAGNIQGMMGLYVDDSTLPS